MSLPQHAEVEKRLRKMGGPTTKKQDKRSEAERIWDNLAKLPTD